MQRNLHGLSPELLKEFQLIHARFDRLESMLPKAPLPCAPDLYALSNQLSPWCEPFVPMNAKKAIPIIDPISKTEVIEKPLVPASTPLESAKIPPPKDSSPLALDAPVPSLHHCLHCLREFSLSRRALCNKDPQKFCTSVCKTNFGLIQKKIWDPNLVAEATSPFIPLLNRSGVELIEGPAGTGKSKYALDICLAEQNEKVVYLTSSWIAAFEFAKKLSDLSLSPFIPAARGDLTDIAIRARDKEFPTFRNPPKGVKHITILIASMTHSSHFRSFPQKETRQNKKSRCFHPKRIWAINDSTPLGSGLVTLGRSVPLPTTMIIDEAGTVLDSVLQTLTVGVKRVVLLGDRYQRRPIEDKELTEVMKPFQLYPLSSNSFREASSESITLLREGHRCPKDAYVLMSSFYGYNVVGQGVRNTLPSWVTDPVAVPTISSLRKGEFTIDELQGQTCEGLTIRTRTSSDMGFLRMHPESVLVAMSRHTSRFSWIDINDKPHNITEFFSRFVNKKVPGSHPDKSLVASRLIEKSRVVSNAPSSPPRPNSRLLSPNLISKLPSSGPTLSDRVDSTIDKPSCTLRESSPVSLSTPLAKSIAQTKAIGGKLLALPQDVPAEAGFVRTSTIAPILPQVPTCTSSDSPAEIVIASPSQAIPKPATEDHDAIASTSIQEGFQSISCNSGKLDSSMNSTNIPSEVPIAQSESDRVASNILERIPPAQRCLTHGCNYSGVAFMSNGMCVKHKDNVPHPEVLKDSQSFPSPSSEDSNLLVPISKPLPGPPSLQDREYLIFWASTMNVPLHLETYPNPFHHVEGSDSRKKCSGCYCGPTADVNTLHHLGPEGLCKNCTVVQKRHIQTKHPVPPSIFLNNTGRNCYRELYGSGTILFPTFSYCASCSTMQEDPHQCTPPDVPTVKSKTQLKKDKKKVVPGPRVSSRDLTPSWK